MLTMGNKGKKNNLVFVTVGTTSFDDLIDTVLQKETLEALESKGFTDLLLQIGRGKEPNIPASNSIAITWYRLKDSIADDMASASLIISHAGAGSCIESLETRNPLVVVVNDKLMGNHQMELASKLNSDGHTVMCCPQTLVTTIENLDASVLTKFPPANPKKFHNYLETIMGFE